MRTAEERTALAHEGRREPHRAEDGMIDPLTRARLLHVLTDADRRQKSNPYALAHYCSALQYAEELMVGSGLTLRQALKTAFCGPIVNRLVKAAGEPPLSDAEVREVR